MMNLEKLKIGDIVILKDQDKTQIKIIDIDESITGRSLSHNTNWVKNEDDFWDLNGIWNGNSNSQFNFDNIIDREEYPEYYL